MPSYLLRQGATLHFRCKVPGDIKGALGCSEIKVSLQTGYRSQAKPRATALAGLCLCAFQAVRGGHGVAVDELRETLRGIVGGAVSLEAGIRMFSVRHCSEGNAVVIAPKSNALDVVGYAASSTMPTVLEAVREYLDQSRPKWRERTYANFEPTLHEFVEIIGGAEKPLSWLSLGVMRQYRNAVPVLPSNVSKRPQYRGMTINEVLQRGVPEADRISMRTIKLRFTVVKGFLKWLRVQYGVQDDFNALLSLDAPKRQFKSNRVCFTDKDILALFGTEEYRQRLFDLPYKFWVPLIGLHQGMRLNEICQLHLADVREVEGFWCFDINCDTEDKRLKTLSSRRVIPLHPELIEMGLLDYVNELRATGRKRLFPELRFGRHGYADVPSKWFARYKRKCGIISKAKVFHSFRNTVSTRLKTAGVSLGVAAQILGHALEKQSMTFDYYADGYSVGVLSEALESMRCLPM